jgi:hypothetical protein
VVPQKKKSGAAIGFRNIPPSLIDDESDEEESKAIQQVTLE